MKKGAAFFLLMLASGAHAASVIKADGEAHAKLGNDYLSISMYLEKQDDNPAQLNREMEAEAAHALDKVKGVTSVKAATVGYSIFPVYDKQRIIGQRANYRLVLETRDFDAGLALAARMQPFQIGNLNFSVSPEKRAAMRKKLLGEAILDMREKMEIVKRSLGASTLAITEISVGASPAVQPMLMSLSRMAVEPGESDISVSVSGTALAK